MVNIDGKKTIEPMAVAILVVGATAEMKAPSASAQTMARSSAST